jgi:hypothetical protein
MTTTYPASPAQTALITRLLGEKDLTGSPFEGHTAAPEGLTGGRQGSASAAIDALFKLPRKGGSAPKVEVPEGMHRASGAIFKVQVAVHGSGNRYAKRLTPWHPASTTGKCYCSDLQGVLCGVCRAPEDTEWSFEYAAGAVKYLSAETLMTKDEAKAFGALYGTCCLCAATLTDEKSIERGMGPDCAKKF